MADLNNEYGYDSSRDENEPEYGCQTYDYNNAKEDEGPGFGAGVALGAGIVGLGMLIYKGIKHLFFKGDHNKHGYRKDDIIDGEFREVTDEEPETEEEANEESEK